jgi:acyl-CoA dehydrogenase
MDFSLEESHELLRESVREFLERECPRDNVRQWDEQSIFPIEPWHAMGKLGWLGLPISEEYGGAGATPIDSVLVEEELTRRCGALGFALSLLSMISLLLQQQGSETQKRELLPRLASGDLIIALAMTEPSGGTDVLALSTWGRRQGDRYILNGQKSWISMAACAQYFLLLARTSNELRRSKGLTLFLVDANAPGVRVQPIKKVGAYKSVDSSEIFLSDVVVPTDQVVGNVGDGFKHLFALLDYERVAAAALALGNAGAAFEDARHYALERHAFGRPIGQFQAIQHYVARMSVVIEQARWVTYRAAWLQTTGLPSELAALQAKVAATEMAAQVTSDALRIFASYGVAAEYDVQRYFRDARLGLFSPISNEMALNVIAQQLGLPKSY